VEDNFWDAVSPEVGSEKVEQVLPTSASEEEPVALSLSTEEVSIPPPTKDAGTAWPEVSETYQQQNEIAERQRLAGEHEGAEWTETMDGVIGVWGTIGLSFLATVLMIVWLVIVLLVGTATYSDYEGKNWETAEASITSYESWVETSCSEDGGCSDTLYVEAEFVLHCYETEQERWFCGSEETYDTMPFEFDYKSSFFDPVPAHYIDESTYGKDTHTVGFDHLDPKQVDLRPGFQFNFEWFIPIVIVGLIRFGVSKAMKHQGVSSMDGFRAMRDVMTGKIVV
jgi:hypothetical protein